MRKMKMMLLSIMAASGLMLSGCGSSDRRAMDVHYITDYFGEGYAGIPYDCGYYTGVTDLDGAYRFDPYDYRCRFDLFDMYEDLYVFDEIGPINGLRYECVPSEFTGYTGQYVADGYFEYETDDYCFIGDY